MPEFYDDRKTSVSLFYYGTRNLFGKYLLMGVNNFLAIIEIGESSNREHLGFINPLVAKTNRRIEQTESSGWRTRRIWPTNGEYSQIVCLKHVEIELGFLSCSRTRFRGVSFPISFFFEKETCDVCVRIFSGTSYWCVLASQLDLPEYQKNGEQDTNRESHTTCSKLPFQAHD